ncbi:hypothetical protein FB107DRAFT_252458 [Schizophyllum commune]
MSDSKTEPLEIELDIPTDEISYESLLQVANRGYARLARIAGLDTVPQVIRRRIAFPASSRQTTSISRATMVDPAFMTTSHPTSVPSYTSAVQSSQSVQRSFTLPLAEDDGDIPMELNDTPFLPIMKLATGDWPTIKQLHALPYMHLVPDIGAHHTFTGPMDGMIPGIYMGPLGYWANMQTAHSTVKSYLRLLSGVGKGQDWPSFMNQLKGLNMITFKVFAFSPAFLSSARPRLWVGLFFWPEHIDPPSPDAPRHPLLEHYHFDKTREIHLRVFPREGERRLDKWVVKLLRIDFVDVPANTAVVIFQGQLLAHLDTGCEAAYLPPTIIRTMRAKASETHVHFADDDELDYTGQNLVTFGPEGKNYLLRLTFEGKENSKPQVIDVAPVHLALTHRNAYRRSDGKKGLAIYALDQLPNARQTEAYIGMNWLQYVWHLYREEMRDGPEVYMVPTIKSAAA